MSIKAGSETLRLTDRKHRAVIEAAVLEFQRDGFGGASMNRIAATAGVSKRTVYNHFSSKEGLFEAILAELLERTGELQGVDYDETAPLKEQLMAIGCELARLIMSDDFIKLARVVVSRFTHSPEIAEATLGSYDKGRGRLVQWVKAANRDGRLDVRSPEQAARQYTSLIQEFAFWPQLLGSKKSLATRELNQVVRTATEMFLSYYSAE